MLRIFSVQHSRGGSGATSVALTLAYNLAKRGRTLYIEADFLNPILEHLIPLKVSLIPRWTNDWITGEASLEDASIDVSSIAGLGLKRLYVMYANTSEGARRRMGILDMEGDKKIVKTLEREKWVLEDKPLDYVVIDTPPWMNYILAAVSYISNVVLYVLRPSLYELEVFFDKMKKMYSHFICHVIPVINFYDQNNDNVRRFVKKFEEHYREKYIKIPVISEALSGISTSLIFSNSNKYADHLNYLFEELTSIAGYPVAETE